jgi:hypothetical protein
VVSDDFAAPFYQFRTAGFGATAALKYGWNNSYGGVNFRIIGMPVGSLVHFLYVDLAGRFGIRMSTSYFLTKLAVFLGVGITMAWICHQLLTLAGKKFSGWTTLFVSSSILFVSLQNHAIWSNDPVASYPLAGFASVILGLACLGITLTLFRKGLTLSRLAFLTVATTTSVLYYEINVAIIIGIAPLLTFVALNPMEGQVLSVRNKLVRMSQVAIPCAMPAIALIYGRILSGSSTQSYGGTTIRLGRVAIHTFQNALASTLPGSSWNLSREQLGGSVGLVMWIIPITVILVSVNTFFLSHPEESKKPDRFQNLGLGTGLFALFCFWTIGVAIQSVTVKVQDESPRIGYVYTYYAIGAVVAAMFLSFIFLYFFSTLQSKSVTVVIVSIFSIFSFVQLTMNWRLMEKMNSSLIPNRELLVAFSSQADVPYRCRALLDWSNGPWPDYYEDGMILGLQSAYLHYHGEQFCPNFERPRP